MLAGVRDYVHPWQLIPLAIFVVGWLWGTGWLLLRSLKRQNYPERVNLGKCVAISLVAGVAGGICGLTFFYLLSSIGSTAGTRLRIPGLAVAAFVTAVVGWLAVYGMLEFSAKQALRAVLVPLAGLFVYGLAIAVPTGIYSVKATQAQRVRERSEDMVAYIGSALETYQRRTGQPAANLKILVQENYIASADLVSPAAPGKEVGYFYCPTRMVPRDTATQQIVLCDLRGNHRDGRNVLFANGQHIWYDEQGFQRLLSADENKQFAAALGEVEPA